MWRRRNPTGKIFPATKSHGCFFHVEKKNELRFQEEIRCFSRREKNELPVIPSILFSVLMVFGTRSDFLILDAFGWGREIPEICEQPFFLPRKASSPLKALMQRWEEAAKPQICVAIHKQQVNFQACSFGGSKMPMIKVVKTIDTASSHFSLSMSYHATKIEIFRKGIESLQGGVHA